MPRPDRDIRLTSEEDAKSPIDAFLGHLLARGVSSHTVRAYRKDVRQFYGQCGIAQSDASPDRGLIERWARDLAAQGYAPASRRRMIASVRSLVKFIVHARQDLRAWGELRFPRCALGTTLPRSLNAAEARSLVMHTEAGALARTAVRSASVRVRSSRDAVIVLLLLATGVRVGELCSVRMSDIDDDAREFRVRGKGRRDRIAFVASEPAWKRVQEYLAARDRIAADDHLLIRANGLALGPQSVRAVVRAMALRAGITRPVTPHMLRHTSATLLLESGTDIRVVQEFLGHKCISVTQRYAHVSREFLKSELRRRIPVSGLVPSVSTLQP